MNEPIPSLAYDEYHSSIAEAISSSTENNTLLLSIGAYGSDSVDWTMFGKHYMNVSVLRKFSQKTSVFTLIIISSP